MELLIVILVFMGIYLFCSIFSVQIKYDRNKVFHGRLSYAIQTFFESQIIFLILAVLLAIVTFGFILFAAPVLVMANAVAGVCVFFIALALYNPIAKRYYLKHTKEKGPRPLGKSDFIKLAIAILLLVVFFTEYHGASMYPALTSQLASKTNIASLVELQKTTIQKDFLYHEIAIDTKRPSLCEKIRNYQKKDDCYAKASS